MVVTLGHQYNIGEKPTVIGYYHQAPAINWSAGVVMGFELALAIDAAARVQHTYKTRPAMKGDLAVS